MNMNNGNDKPKLTGPDFTYVKTTVTHKQREHMVQAAAGAGVSLEMYLRCVLRSHTYGTSFNQAFVRFTGKQNDGIMAEPSQLRSQST